jgi:hypothetical protein
VLLPDRDGKTGTIGPDDQARGFRARFTYGSQAARLVIKTSHRPDHEGQWDAERTCGKWNGAWLHSCAPPGSLETIVNLGKSACELMKCTVNVL